jgi:putative ABC transport system permease protein
VTRRRRRRPFGERAYAALLRLFPRSFRTRYSDDMLDFYRERVAATRRSFVAVARLWSALLADLVASAIAERFARPRRVSPQPFQLQIQPEQPMSTLHQDVRYAVRGIVHHPAFAAVILLTIALGIGANAAIFTVVNAVLLRPLPFKNVERIVTLQHDDPYSQVSEGEFVDYSRGMPSLPKLAAFSGATVTLTVGDEAIRTHYTRVSRDFFDVLGVKPIVGRTFAPDEFLPSAKGRIVVISHALWQQQFAGDTQIVGHTLTINGTPVTIIGVMPPGFNYPDVADSFWAPWRLNTDSLWGRNNHYLRLVGSMAPGATLSQVRAQAAVLDQQWMREYPDIYQPGRPLVAVIVPLEEKLLGQTRPYMLALLGAVGFILLIACVNVANLLLARGESRRKEMAIRTTLGTSGSRIVRQMLTESMLLAAAGAVIGTGFAWLGTRALVRLAPGDLPRLDQISVDTRVVVFTVAITILTGLLFGLVPAARGIRGDSVQSLRDGGKTSAISSAHLVRSALVTTEVAMAVVMLSGAGLLIRSLAKLRGIDLGFATQHILTMDLSIPARRQYTDTTADELYRQIRQRVAHLPGVRSAAMEGALPITGDDSDWSIMLDGRVVKTIAEAATGKPDQVTPDFFTTMSIPVLIGRPITEEDQRGSPPVVVINETMAKKLYPGVNPIGHTLKMFNPAAPWVTIVGVVADVKARGFLIKTRPTMYFSYSQAANTAYYQPSTMTLVVRTVGDPVLQVNAIRSIVRSLDSHMPISRVATMDDIVGQSIASRRFTTLLLGGFAGLAVLLAGIGIYGVISFGVTQRTYEIGVRMALGASTSSVMRLVVAEGFRMALVGLIVGVGGALMLDRLLQSLLVDVSPRDIPTFAGVVVVLAAVAAVACAVPARRATSVSPTEALRNG